MSVILLDTQVLLWWLSDDARLGAEARRKMAHEDLSLSQYRSGKSQSRQGWENLKLMSVRLPAPLMPAE